MSLDKALGEQRSRAGRADVLNAARGAFTLIEVLVVVAIIALLVAVLLPSLARGREQAKMMVCLGHLKEMGSATAMYTLEHRDTLPGPLHPTMFQNVSAPPPPLDPLDVQKHLPSMLRKYFSESVRGSGGMAAEIASCPSHPTPARDFLVYNGAPRAFHYAINTWVYTDPYMYFGFIVHGATYETWKRDYKDRWGPNSGAPKKLSQIDNQAREWVIADAFCKPEPDVDPRWPPELATLPHGSYPDASQAQSGGPLPRSPFHLGSGYKREGPKWAYKGRTCTLYLDMHAESQRGWKGTVNPSDRN